jgi:hypothetical protein
MSEHMATSLATSSQLNPHSPPPLIHVFNSSSMLLCIQLNLDRFNVMALQFMGAIMAMGWTQAQSHHLARFNGFRPAFWKAMAHSSSWPPESWPPPADCLVFCLWLEFPWRSRPSVPSTHPPVRYFFWFWLDSCPSNNSYHALHLWFPVFFLMPRLRGKSKWGVTWYAARGRGSRG